MTKTGTGDGGSVRALRALTAVVALYALAMQAFFGGIAASAASPAPAFEMPCRGGAAQTDPSAPQSPADRHPCCCCAAAQPGAGTPVLPVATSTMRPARRAAQVLWQMDGGVPARARQSILASARAPPVA